MKKPPAAPPAYRPNPLPRALQLRPRPGPPSPVAPINQTIQRALVGGGPGGGGGGGGDWNPYKKHYDDYYLPTRTSKRKSAQRSPYGRPEPQSERLRGRMGALGGGRPNYVPPKDSEGNFIWDGGRKGLGWSPVIKGAMAPSKAAGCQVNKPGCTGSSDGIDHRDPFSNAQSSITRYMVCDGRHHWVASYRDDAHAIYNNNDDESNMVWACTNCNSSKGGVKGRYENAPKWLGPCPGNCGYEPRGEER